MANEPQTHRILINFQSQDWSVHFMDSDGKTRIGPWLLFDSADDIRRIFKWARATPEQLEDFESCIRRWGQGSVSVTLTDKQRAHLIERGKGWPWNGYELSLMKKVGMYPPKQL